MSQDQYAHTGRVMFLLAWIVLFGVLFLFFYYHDQSGSSGISVSHNELVLRADRDGHYRTKGAINNYPVQFLVDTGASMVAIPQDLAERLHIPGRYPITLSTANGEVTGLLTRLEKLSFGAFTFEDVKAVIIPGDSDNTVLLGMNVLSKLNIIQQDQQLLLKR